MFTANVQRWERSVHGDEEELERAGEAEGQHVREIDEDTKKLEELKSERLSKKKDRDNMDEDMAVVCPWPFEKTQFKILFNNFLLKARRDMRTVTEDLQNVRKAIAGMEAKIDQKRSDRHNILKQCKVGSCQI